MDSHGWHHRGHLPQVSFRAAHTSGIELMRESYMITGDMGVKSESHCHCARLVDALSIYAVLKDLAQHNLPFASTCNHRLQGLLSKLFKSPKHCGMQPTRQLCPRASEKNTIPIASQQHLLQHALTAAAASNRQRAAASNRSSQRFCCNDCRSRIWRLSMGSLAAKLQPGAGHFDHST